MAAEPDILAARPAWAVLRYIDVGEDAGIRFEEMLHELDWIAPVREMVEVAWALFNGGRFVEPGRGGEPPIMPPTFDTVVCRLDLGNLVAVLEAMRLRKGLSGPPAPPLPTTDEERESYRCHGLTDDMIDQIAEDAARRILRDNNVECSRSLHRPTPRGGFSTGNAGCDPDILIGYIRASHQSPAPAMKTPRGGAAFASAYLVIDFRPEHQKVVEPPRSRRLNEWRSCGECQERRGARRRRICWVSSHALGRSG